jgi:hypothetical protein
MQDKLSQEIIDRLKILETAIQRDLQSLQPSPVFIGGQAVSQQLFDAVQSTLQNVEDSSADEAV